MNVPMHCRFFFIAVTEDLYYNTKEQPKRKGKREMETKYYTVSRIDGDYAWLTCTSAEEEPYFIARALLPMEIDEGSNLKLENFQFVMA